MMTFELFDHKRELHITTGNLPHWFQPGVTYFITFRTEDSIPVEVAELWYYRRDDWLRSHGINPTDVNWQEALRKLPDDQQLEFQKTFSREFHAYLDKGYGACVLKRQELSRIVAGSLLHFDGKRYHMGDFVVMPNHVHLVACLIGSTDVVRQCYSWKKFTAAKINVTLGCRG